MNYEEASTPRSKVKGKVYTSTEISPKVEIPIHNEMSYASNFPNNLWFYSSVVAKKKGDKQLLQTQKKFMIRLIQKSKENLKKTKKYVCEKVRIWIRSFYRKMTFNTKNKKNIKLL